MNTTIAHQNVDVEAIVKKVMAEMAPTKSLPKTKSTKNWGLNLSMEKGTKKSTKKSSKKSRDDSNKSSKSSKSNKKDRDGSRKSTKSKRKSKKNTKNNDKLTRSIEMLVSELEILRKEQSDEGLTGMPRVPSKVLLSDRAMVGGDSTIDISCFDNSGLCSYELSTETRTTAESTKSETTKQTVGTEGFYKEVASRLSCQRKSICIQGDFMPSEDEIEESDGESSSSTTIEDFEAAFGPNDMRCLALVSHNGMKATMKNFVIHHKHILKKFRLTGTQSTMKMLAEVFHDEPDICFGPACQSGPLGGDAELVALMTAGKLGGILFFQDPMSSHPHEADIQCLVRQAMVHNTLIANTPTTAMSLMQVFRLALEGAGKPELLPSFFFSLQSPTVDSYKAAQKEVVKRASRVTFER